MKMYKKIFLIFSFAMLTALFFTSCKKEEMQNDADIVTAFIHNLNGPNVGYEAETMMYSVTPTRGGSEYIWTITGAEAVPVAGRTDQMNVYFNQITDPVSVSVVEKAANGDISEPKTINLAAVLGVPCNYTLEMQDSYGDGWNGASVQILFEGEYVLGEYTIEDGTEATATVPIPNEGEYEVIFTSGDWDSEVTYQLYDPSGEIIFGDGPTPFVGTAFTDYNVCP